MTAQQPTIVATSIGFRSMHLGEWDWQPGPVYRYAADLAQAGPAPQVCIIATALGDHPGYLTAMYAAFGRVGTVFHEAVSDTVGARAWHLTRNDDGTVREEPLPTRLLPDWDPSA